MSMLAAAGAAIMCTDEVSAAERPSFWADCIARLFSGLESDLYGDADFDGRMATVRAGDVVLTRLEANRHRVTRPAPLAQRSEADYLKIVAPGPAALASSRRDAKRGSRPTSGASTTPRTATRWPTRCASNT